MAESESFFRFDEKIVLSIISLKNKTMADIIIKKVKLLKQGEKLEIDYQETGDMQSTVSKTCENAVHPDLKNAVSALAVHLALLTDYITEKRARDKEELEKFVVTGYSIGSKEDDEGVVITGYRKTRSGKTHLQVLIKK